MKVKERECICVCVSGCLVLFKNPDVQPKGGVAQVRDLHHVCVLSFLSCHDAVKSHVRRGTFRATSES